MIKVHKNILIDMDKVKEIRIVRYDAMGKHNLRFFYFGRDDLTDCDPFDSYEEAEKHLEEIEKIVCKGTSCVWPHGATGDGEDQHDFYEGWLNKWKQK